MTQQKYVNIPIPLIELAIQDKIARPFRTYIWLKTICSGKLRITKEVEEQFKIDFNYKDHRNFWKHLDVLLKRNWVGHNPTSGIYFIRGFGNIMNQENLYGRQRSEFSIKDFSDFDEWMFSSTIQSWIKNREAKKSESTKADSKQDSDSFPKDDSGDGFKPNQLSGKLIAKRLNRTEAWVSKTKKKCLKSGYLKYTHRYHPLDITVNFIKMAKKSLSDIAHKIVSFNNFLYVQLVDELTPLKVDLTARSYAYRV